MSSARQARDPNGKMAYSIFQQGAGLIDAAAARESTQLACANLGLDIAADLAGTRHYGGPARQGENGDYFVADSSGYNWQEGNPWADGNPVGTASSMAVNAWVDQE